MTKEEATALENRISEMCKSKLTPNKCPKCGETPIVHLHPCAEGHGFEYRYGVECLTCGVVSRFYSCRDDAIQEWNSLAPFRNNSAALDNLPDLRPCPLCNSKAILNALHIKEQELHRVICPVCGFRVPFTEKKEYAILLWNRRTDSRTLKIKRCPLCGASATALTTGGIDHGVDVSYHYIECDNSACGCQTRVCDSVEEAADLWNGDFSS